MIAINTINTTAEIGAIDRVASERPLALLKRKKSGSSQKPWMIQTVAKYKNVAHIAHARPLAQSTALPQISSAIVNSHIAFHASLE